MPPEANAGLADGLRRRRQPVALRAPPDPGDHRSRQVHLTPRGREVAMTMRGAVAELETEWSALLGREGFEHLRALLTRLSEGLGRSAPTSSG
jgi:hypothetical protein